MNNYTKKNISLKIKKYIGGTIKFLKKSHDKRNYIVDFSKIKKKLGFKPKYSIEYGIKEILNHLEKYKNVKNKLQSDSFGNYKIIKWLVNTLLI